MLYFKKSSTSYVLIAHNYPPYAIIYAVCTVCTILIMKLCIVRHAAMNMYRCMVHGSKVQHAAMKMYRCIVHGSTVHHAAMNMHRCMVHGSTVQHATMNMYRCTVHGSTVQLAIMNMYRRTVRHAAMNMHTGYMLTGDNYCLLSDNVYSAYVHRLYVRTTQLRSHSSSIH